MTEGKDGAHYTVRDAVCLDVYKRQAFGKSTEVNPCGFTVLVEDNEPEHVGYFSVYCANSPCIFRAPML